LIDDWWVQGRSGPDRELLDTASLVGHLVPAGSVYAFLAEHRGEVFPDGLFADLFPSGRGRPSVPAEVIASVLVLQTLRDYSDAEAMDALRCDLRWKVACGLPIDHEGFHPTTLTVWRNRLRASTRPERIFETVRAVVAETGVLKGKTRRALDSVVLDDAVATQDTVTQLVAAVRRVRRLVPGAAEVIAQRCHAHDWDDAGKPPIAWDDKAARDALVSALVNDANTVIAALHEVEVDAPAAQALALLALVAGQDVEPAEGSDGTDGRWRIARRVAEDRVISTVDPQARHVHKTVHHRQDGFKAHVAVEPDTGLFTAGELTEASGQDNHEAVVGLSRWMTTPTRAGSRCWAIRRTAPATLGRRWPRRDTPRSSNQRRCARPSTAGSPWTSSPSTSTPVSSPARAGSPGASPPPGATTRHSSGLARRSWGRGSRVTGDRSVGR
jgi:transposase